MKKTFYLFISLLVAVGMCSCEKKGNTEVSESLPKTSWRLASEDPEISEMVICFLNETEGRILIRSGEMQTTGRFVYTATDGDGSALLKEGSVMASGRRSALSIPVEYSNVTFHYDLHKKTLFVKGKELNAELVQTNSYIALEWTPVPPSNATPLEITKTNITGHWNATVSLFLKVLTISLDVTDDNVTLVCDAMPQLNYNGSYVMDGNKIIVGDITLQIEELTDDEATINFSVNNIHLSGIHLYRMLPAGTM